jgi:acyl-CoA thioester hydrolase
MVYHASYLRFMERGRTNYLRLLGADQRALFEETEKEAPGFAFCGALDADRVPQSRTHG